MSPLGHLILARLREFYREPAALFWTYGFPTLLALALGLAFRGGDGRATPIAVIEGPFASERAAVLAQDPGLSVRTVSPRDVDSLFLGGGIVLAVGADPALEYRFDDTHPESEAVRRRVDDHLQRAAGRIDPLPTRDRPVTAPGSRYIDFLIPGLIGMNIMSSSMWGIGYTIVEARKRRLLKRLAATPMRHGDFLLSFILARLIFLATEVAILLAFAVLVFDVVVQGSWLWIAALSVAGAMAFAGLAMLAASRTQSTETVSGLMNLIMLPMWVLSGVFFASSHFPDWMQPMIKPLPLTLLNDAMRAVINEGATSAQVALPFAVLSVGAALTRVVAVRVFRWN